MISYSWGPPPHENKDLARDIESVLVGNKLDVWRDETKMRSSILDAMAEGVQQASCIIVLVTRNYKESANCKLELTFAMKKKKKIVPLLAEADYNFETDGWLGLALGDLLYYDVSQSENREKELLKMLKLELSWNEPRRLSTVAVAHPATAETAPAHRATTETAPAHRATTETLHRFPSSEQEVRDWVSKIHFDPSVADALVREGFVDKESLTSLSRRKLMDIKEALDLHKGADASKFKDCLEKLVE